jgi:hypothetical protein
MNGEQQEAVVDLWRGFLAGRRPSGWLMREFYTDVFSRSDCYAYGLAPEVFDVLIHGAFYLEDAVLWSSAWRADHDHRAA